MELSELAAAASALDVLRGECSECGGRGYGFACVGEPVTGEQQRCTACHGEGTAWSDEVVEAVGRALAAYNRPGRAELEYEAEKEAYDGDACAALNALEALLKEALRAT